MRDLIKEIPLNVAFYTYWSWTLLFLVGHIRDALAQLFFGGTHKESKLQKGYAPLRQDYEDFYTRRAYYRVIRCFNRPVSSAPTRVIDIVMHNGKPATPEQTPAGHKRTAINLGSYNYLGFASQDPYCTPRVQAALRRGGIALGATRVNGGTTSIHENLEARVAKFVGKEAALFLGMGYATNSSVLPILCSKGDLIISDALNHSSIVVGARGSGAKVKVFKHNNAKHLDRLLRAAIAEGQPRTHRPWRKILIVVEGIYSMEGELCCLREIVEVKKKYGVYLYLDEAHSIGALGETGRGICEKLGVPFGDVDIMMGTFTKSFGSSGGYIASSAAVIQHLYAHCPSFLMATSMSAPVVEQIAAAFDLISGADGSGRGCAKMETLRANSNYFRWHLIAAGFNVLGEWDSPVMPIMLYLPGAILRFSEECLTKHVAVVVVGFPATSLLTARARICISASHTREDLDYSLLVLREVGARTGCLYKLRCPDPLPPLADVLKGCGAAGAALLRPVEAAAVA